MKKIVLFITFSIALIAVNAQDSFNQNFLEANTLMEENQFNVALPIWLKLLAEQPDNFNINYKIGVCYINSATEKNKAKNYLIKAINKTTNNYNPFSSTEKKAPIESYFYLARSYHINNELDDALVNYTIFKSKITKKHYLFKEVDHHIEQCNNAKIAMENPVSIKINNLGPIINSVSGDYSPVLSIDESTIYFTSRRVRKDSSNYYITDPFDGKQYEDIYVSNNIDGVWTEPELLGINTEGHEATVNISADGQTLFIYKDDNGDGNIYTSTLEGEDWTTPVKLGSDINLESRETHAHVTPDGNTLYFVSDRDGGFGGQDIYKCNRLPNGEWAKAQNIGNVINTPYDEDGVFIHPDGKSMYFSSKGHSSIGGYDIFQSVLDESGNWTAPVNIGYPVNSTDDDVFFVTSTDGKRGYYSSFKEDGFGEKDIYMISLIDAKEKPLTLLSGYIKVIGSDLPDDALITVKNASFEKSLLYKPRKKDGKFSIILEPDNEYHIVYTAGRFMHEEDLYIPPASSYQELSRSIGLVDVVFIDTLKIQEKQRQYLADSTHAYNEVIDSTNEYVQMLRENFVRDSTYRYQFVLDSTATYIHILDSTTTYKEEHTAFYQLFFNFDVNKINTLDSGYVRLIAILEKQAKKNGKVYIVIEGSASMAPHSSYGSNLKLAVNRTELALKMVTKSLNSRGIDKKRVVVTDQISRVQGIAFDESIDKNVYLNYQYIIIKNGDKPTIPVKKY